MFPTTETIELFDSVCKRDGIKHVVSDFIDNKKDEYKPLFKYFKTLLKMLNDDKIPDYNKLDEPSFTLGFLICFNLFRLQIESENLDIEDYKININSLEAYIQFLEKDNSSVKIKND